MDKIYNKSYVDDEFINKNKNFPNKIKKSLEKGKLINKEWDNNKMKLNSIINDCLSIENNINYINEINKNIEKYKSNEETIIFVPDKEKEINEYLENIRKFGEIYEYNKLFLNSDIIGDDIKIKKEIKNWINHDINMKFSLLFKMSRDGSNSSDFHRACDNKGKTLTIIETDNGYKFGGFTPLDWENDKKGKEKNDDLTFLFSINQMKKFKKKNNGRSIYCRYDLGPLFGSGSDLGIHSNMKTGWSDNSTFLSTYDLTNGSSSFNVKEMEIFKIDYINN